MKVCNPHSWSLIGALKSGAEAPRLFWRNKQSSMMQQAPLLLALLCSHDYAYILRAGSSLNLKV